jgi:plastocyanin
MPRHPSLSVQARISLGSRLATLLMAFVSLAMYCGVAQADALIDETSLVGLPTVAAPSQFSFTASATEALTVTLTDFQTPAAFSNLQIAVTQDDMLVGSATADSSHTAAVAITAAAGSVYVVYVIGTPATTQGIGSFGACVTRNADPTPRSCVPAYSFSGNIETPAAPNNTGVSTLNTTFAATSSGTYQVTLTDDAFPVPLQMVSATIFSGSSQIGGVIPAGAATPVALTGGVTYTLLVAAQAAASPQAGLYGVHITDPSGAPVFDRTLPVGALGASTVVANPGVQALTLTLNDFAYPASLGLVGGAVTSGGVALGTLTAAGTLPNIMAPAGNLEVWQYALPGGGPGVYSLSLAGSAATLYSTTQVVNPGGTASSGSFAFVVQLPASGTYNLSVSDFQFPGVLQGLSSTIAQNGVALTVGSNGDFMAGAGLAVVVVNAQAPTSGNGIFAVTVETKDSPAQILLDQTQAVGGVFNTRVINYGASGSYTVSLADLGFPTNFQNLAVVLSQGSQVLGKIFGSGTFPISATPGQYVLTFVAAPGAENYGLYSIKIASAVPALSFTTSASSVSAGQTVQLTWSSQNAVSCTAAGNSGWTGDQPLTGTTAVSIAANVTLTLSCTGPGGSVTQSVSVAISTPAASGSKGGGGDLDPALLSLLAMLLLGRWQFARFIGHARLGRRLSHPLPGKTQS